MVGWAVETAQEKPVGQVVHCNDPATLYEPAGQLSGAVIVESGQYFPAGHYLQILKIFKLFKIIHLIRNIVVCTRLAPYTGN
jgi:hypothetical protein